MSSRRVGRLNARETRELGPEEACQFLFSSYQHHLNKVNGEIMPMLEIPNVPDRRFLNEQEKRELLCQHVENDCRNEADYLISVMGYERLCCAQHMDTVTPVLHRIHEPSSWLCRELQREKPVDDCFWFVAWKVPTNLRENLGLLIWLWYPTITTNSSRPRYRFYRQKDETLQLPKGAAWFQATKDEMRRLLGQLIYEKRRGKSPYIIGFASDEPFDRPDPSLGYSITKQQDGDLKEPYCFNYHKVVTPERLEQVLGQALGIDYHPYRGSCNPYGRITC